MLGVWVDTAERILRSGGSLTLIFQAEGIADVLQACDPGFGAVAIMPIYPKPGLPAIRILVRALRDVFEEAGVAAQMAHVGSMWGLFFSAAPVTDLTSAQTSDIKAYAAFFHAMLDNGVYLAPSQFEAAFVSTAHSAEDIAQTARAARAARS